MSTENRGTYVHVSKKIQIDIGSYIVHEQHEAKLHKIVQPKLGETNPNENKPASDSEDSTSSTQSIENQKKSITLEISKDGTPLLYAEEH